MGYQHDTVRQSEICPQFRSRSQGSAAEPHVRRVALPKDSLNREANRTKLHAARLDLQA